jgi:hypothetical protein
MHHERPHDADVDLSHLPLDAPHAAPLDELEQIEQGRGEEFIQLFNEIDHHIKRLVKSNGGEGFFRRVQWATRDQPALKRYSDDLIEFAELRNALVHDRRFPNKVIAVPTADTLRHFRQLVERIVRPRRVIPLFASDLRVFAPDELLSAALEYMHQRGFTQIVVRDRGELRLATASGITRWLAAAADGPPRVGSDGKETPASCCVDLAAATVGDIVALEKPEALALVAADTTLEEAVDVFQRAVAGRHGRLFALLITQHGRATEPPLGIITPADLLDED